MMSNKFVFISNSFLDKQVDSGKITTYPFLSLLFERKLNSAARNFVANKLRVFVAVHSEDFVSYLAPF